MPDNYYSEVNENGVVTPFRDLAAFPRSEQEVLGAENLFASFTSDSKNGMTFTVDSDGVVDVDGEPTSDYVNIKSVFTLKKGTYTVSGVPSGYGSNKMLIALYDMNNVQIAVDNGSGATFTLNADTQLQGYIYVYQAYGDFDHVKVYPMINLGTVVRSFVPYAMTNRQLTKKALVQTIDHSTAITEGDLSVTFTEYITGNVEQIVGTVTSGVDKDASSISQVSLGSYLAHKPPLPYELIGSINSSISANDRKPVCNVTMGNSGKLSVRGQMVANRPFDFVLTFIFVD